MKRLLPKTYTQGRVYDVVAPGRHGKVIRPGEQVSEVRWDDGVVQYVTNEYLGVLEDRA